MSQPKGQFTVVGQKQQTFRKIIQPADWEKPLRPVGGGQVVEDRGPAFGIAGRGHASRLLVQHEGEGFGLFLRRGHGATVHGQGVAPGIDFNPEFGHDPAVDAHPAGGNEGIGLAPGTIAGGSQGLVEAQQFGFAHKR